MITEQHEIEGAALSMYHRASVDPERAPGALRLTDALCIRVDFVPGLASRARLLTAPERIELRSQLSPAAAEYVCGHELGHLDQDQRACGDARLERVCNRIATAIVAPRPAMFLLRMAFGYRIAEIARALGTTERLVAVRWGEVFDEPVALIESRRVSRAGPTIGASDAELRRVVLAGGAAGVRLVRVESGVMLIGEG